MHLDIYYIQIHNKNNVSGNSKHLIIWKRRKYYSNYNHFLCPELHMCSIKLTQYKIGIGIYKANAIEV